ncbi:MAG: class I SAM-dependent DNA methyltransferase, partial [Gammaproteobacteria bacterium]|nr:class I SAM-dependent DNA methyltransferase [Gammaproteobacteria bacterium]
MTPQAFIDKWDGKDGSERANYQIFFNDLCELLEVEKPLPSHADDWQNAYVFERYIEAIDGESAGASRFIDTYLSGKFICESKSFGEGKTANSGDTKLFKAKSQAESYARNLPESEPRPPFLIVINVGRVIALYAQFKDDDRSYAPYPDRAGYKISIKDLARDDIRARLRQLWLDPNALNPELIAAEVTRAVAIPLGLLARQLEEAGHDPHQVAGFLTRCLFTMFAEDIGLLPAGVFTGLLTRAVQTPKLLAANLEDLWRAMDKGGVSLALQQEIAHFNGKLFKTPDAILLAREQIETLLGAARQDWRHVEPAIFGTLIERALDPVERHALGAHFTPRAYVERLVLPTVIDPLRERWANVQAAAIALDDEGDHKGAIKLVRDFQGQLCQTRVLDPACGSGNFLYIALEYMKRLEGDVLEQLDAFGATLSLETEGLSVDPHQFIGLELNPRAAAVAELVLWIGYLQWHFRTRGKVQPPSPVLRDFKNIRPGDAMLDSDGQETPLDAQGQPITRWDGKTYKQHPATGKNVPDESARVAAVRYLNPRQAKWPKAQYVVGNPPFIGAATLRAALGDGYVEALRDAHGEVPESADLVMFWWDHAARLLAKGKIERFGFITTNSLSQTFNRRVLENHLGKNMSLAFAIPDHPWVDSADGAAVRVAMTVVRPGAGEGRLLRVTRESTVGDGEVAVTLAEKIGLIHADLSIGADVAGAGPLKANAGISSPGFKLHGA